MKPTAAHIAFLEALTTGDVVGGERRDNRPTGSGGSQASPRYFHSQFGARRSTTFIHRLSTILSTALSDPKLSG